MVAVVAAIGLLFDKLAGAKTEALQALHQEVEPLKLKSQQFDTARANLKKTQTDVDQIVTWMDERYYWPDVFSALRDSLTKVETQMKTKLRADAGIWIENFITAEPRVVDLASQDAGAATPEVSDAARRAAADEAFRKRYGLMRARPAASAETASSESSTTVEATGTPARKKKAGPNEVASMTITFRAISLGSLSPEANKEIVYSVLNEIKSNPLFDPDWTDPDGKGLGAEEPPGTFTFGITVGLKRPFKL
jgi:hypothetical protein